MAIFCLIEFGNEYRLDVLANKMIVEIFKKKSFIILRPNVMKVTVEYRCWFDIGYIIKRIYNTIVLVKSFYNLYSLHYNVDF